MDALILNTNIISFIIRKDTRATLYAQYFDGKVLAISFMTVSELYEGGFRKNWTEKKWRALRGELRKYLIIPYSPSICETWGRIRAERMHQPISVDDAWIAASALIHNCPLVTDNSIHFTDISGLQIITVKSN